MGSTPFICAIFSCCVILYIGENNEKENSIYNSVT